MDAYHNYLLCTPPLSKDCSNIFLERSFLLYAPRVWNSLDENIRKFDFNMFRKRVKTKRLFNIMNADSLRLYYVYVLRSLLAMLLFTVICCP